MRADGEGCERTIVLWWDSEIRREQKERIGEGRSAIDKTPWFCVRGWQLYIPLNPALPAMQRAGALTRRAGVSIVYCKQPPKTQQQKKA